jgi:NitT/TauT family transport system ATP-binding protein
VPAVGAPKDSTIAAAMTTAIEPISVNLLAGLLETVAAPPYNGKADLPPLAAELQLEVDEIFPIAEALTLMQFALLADGDVKLTEAGKKFVEEGIEERKHRFAEALRTHVPLAAAIRAVLDERPSHRASAARFRDELEDHMSPDYADATLRAVIGWGRFAELYAYDEDADQFFLEEEE